MKNTNSIKIFLVALIGIMLVMVSTNVFAANDTNGFADISNTLNGTVTNNTSNTSNTNNTSNTGLITNNTSNTSNTNTSIYNNVATNLPKTGVESTIPVAMIVVVCAISALYAYKKINDYKNV